MKSDLSYSQMRSKSNFYLSKDLLWVSDDKTFWDEFPLNPLELRRSRISAVGSVVEFEADNSPCSAGNGLLWVPVRIKSTRTDKTV